MLSQTVEIAELPLHVVNDEPRVLDTDLAQRLGFDRPVKVRDLIKRNRAEIETFGPLPTVGRVINGGQAVEAYLNEEQALLVAALSKAPRAPEVRAALIRTFVALRRGQISALPSDQVELLRRTDGIARMLAHKVTEIEKALPALVTERIEALLAADPRHVAVAFRPALDMLKDHDVPPKKRRGLVLRVSAQLRSYSAMHGFQVRRSRETGRWLFEPAAMDRWYRETGASVIRAHIDRIRGQAVLPFVVPKPRGE
jgi:hypothetical protein